MHAGLKLKFAAASSGAMLEDREQRAQPADVKQVCAWVMCSVEPLDIAAHKCSLLIVAAPNIYTSNALMQYIQLLQYLVGLRFIPVLPDRCQ